MGTYVNPGNDGFRRILEGEYVDKTGLIGLVNEAAGTSDNLVCVTRPRRFGKSFAAEALVAYYSCGCDSRALFEGLAVSETPLYREHLNAHNVVRLDMTELTSAAGKGDVAPLAEGLLLPELRDLVPEAGARHEGMGTELTATILDVVRATGRRFVFVIDEWDAPLRECPREEDKRAWVELLRSLFKNASFTGEAVEAAYITGILPIRRYDGQSAVSDFREYTFLDPGPYAPYTGLTEAEVASLAERHGMGMAELRSWYDGYELEVPPGPGEGEWQAVSVYAPFSVMTACQRGKCASYWPTSATFDSLRRYVDMDFGGLQGRLASLVAGTPGRVETVGFENDMRGVHSADDVITLLAHLGYLSYSEPEPGDGWVRVPNEEVRRVLAHALRRSQHPKTMELVAAADAVLAAVWDGDAEAVAAGVARVHDTRASIFYNHEESLRSTVREALLTAGDHYARVEELPSGRGFADIAYLPRRYDPAPPMVVELKWDRPVTAAIDQIRARNYPAVLKDLAGEVLLVGITYDPKTKEHTCEIGWA